MKRSAVISDCGTYRYELTRQWSERPSVTWIMLNPSTADSDVDDPTIRRCIGFANAWGYGGIIVRNLYALRATDPRELRDHPDPVGPSNDEYLRRCNPLVICAWGAGGANRAVRVVYRLTAAGTPLHCLAWTKAGEPRHPLYLKGDLKPISMNAELREALVGGAS